MCKQSGSFVLTFRIIINLICPHTSRPTGNCQAQTTALAMRHLNHWKSVVFNFLMGSLYILISPEKCSRSILQFRRKNQIFLTDWNRCWCAWPRIISQVLPYAHPSLHLTCHCCSHCPVLFWRVPPLAALLVQSSPLRPSSRTHTARVGWEGVVGRHLLIEVN